jgi:hypothetical protein
MIISGHGQMSIVPGINLFIFGKLLEEKEIRGEEDWGVRNGEWGMGMAAGNVER